jgi:hypothetical protein
VVHTRKNRHDLQKSLLISLRARGSLKVNDRYPNEKKKKTNQKTKNNNKKDIQIFVFLSDGDVTN